MSYGSLALSAAACTIMAIVMIVAYIVSAILYANRFVAGALATHLVGIVLTLVLMATWVTTIDWSKLGPFPIVGLIFWGCIAAAPAACAE